MNIWNVHNPIKVESDFVQFDKVIQLWRLDFSNFKVIEQGAYTPILENAAYTLIKNKYASIFQELTDQVEITPVKICDSVLNTENIDYVELKIKNTITPNTITIADSNECKVWSYNGHLFVSSELKTTLENIANGELAFYLGFSMFGG